MLRSFLLVYSVGLCSISLKFVWIFWWIADKDRELSESQAEIKALRLSERAREKAVEEVNVPILLPVKSFVCCFYSLLNGC